MMSAPLLILMDCQKEHLPPACSERRAESDELVDRIGRLLTNARYAGWTVAHCQLAREAKAFEAFSSLTGPIDKLRPAGREPVFRRRAYSAYSDRAFERMIGEYAERSVYIAGFSAPFSLMSTAFDAHERGHRPMLVSDAVGASPMGARSADTVCDLALTLIGRLIPLVNGEDVIEDWPLAPMPAAINQTGMRP